MTVYTPSKARERITGSARPLGAAHITEQSMELWERRRKLGAEMTARIRIYLDTRFWNDFCDVQLREHRDPAAESSLRALQASVDAGTVICPIEFYVFSELQKQRLPEKRLVTAKLVDRLSSGVTMVSPPERVFLEILRFVQALLAGKTPPPKPIYEVWTKPAYMAGHVMPELPTMGLPDDILRALREEFDQQIWDLGYEDLTRMSELHGAPIDDRSHTAQHLNRAKDHLPHQLPTYKATYEAEVLGALDGHIEELEQVLDYLRERAGLDPSAFPQEQTRQAAMKVRDIIYAGWLKRDLRQSLPGLHVGAALYAHIQWDRPRRYKPNDMFDIGHAEAAVPYCNAFATDGPLASLLKSSRVAAEYGCEVLSTHAELRTWAERRVLRDREAR